MSDIDNIFIQVRARLNAESIKLWEEPYYLDGIGPIDDEIERLSVDFSRELGIAQSKCRFALSELQDGALRKLAARKDYEDTGMATFRVRCIAVSKGTTNITDVKCQLSSPGVELQALLADKLKLGSASNVKCISAGRIVDAERTLEAQGLKNNQQLMVIVGNGGSNDGNGPGGDKNSEAMYERIKKIKADVELIVGGDRQFMELEDQDGNPVFMPPEENRAMSMGLGFCEKARVAMRREQYDEALLLLLEADEHFSNCNSKFLETVDNYALLNLDVVWCYLSLKNLSQLPDAERRLDICERHFRRSYGENYDRLIALKGNSCPERALIVRLHILQGIIYFHQNRRDEAYERLDTATVELHDLKVNELQLQTLLEMGFEASCARSALRACSGDLERAVQFIHDRSEQLRATRKKSDKEREMQRNLAVLQNDSWVNPRSVCTLMEMGYECDLVVEALTRSDNDVPTALTLIQTRGDELRANMAPKQTANQDILRQLADVGFNENLARIALETNANNTERAIDFLLKLFGSESDVLKALERMSLLGNENSAEDLPSTSTGRARARSSSLQRLLEKKAKEEMDSYVAFRRFNEDLESTDWAYLDLPLVEEEKLLNEYKRLLQQ